MWHKLWTVLFFSQIQVVCFASFGRVIKVLNLNIDSLVFSNCPGFWSQRQYLLVRVMYFVLMSSEFQLGLETFRKLFLRRSEQDWGNISKNSTFIPLVFEMSSPQNRLQQHHLTWDDLTWYQGWKVKINDSRFQSLRLKAKNCGWMLMVTTVGGRNPALPGMYKALKIMK